MFNRARSKGSVRECIHTPLMPNGQGCCGTPCLGLKKETKKELLTHGAKNNKSQEILSRYQENITWCQ